MSIFIVIKQRWLSIIIIVFTFISGCSSNNYAPVFSPIVPKNKPGQYYVRPGDTLFSIAWAYGLDYRTLERMNGIRPGEQIQPGQYLIVKSNYVAPRQQGYAAKNAPTFPLKTPVASKVKTVRTPQSVAIQTTKFAPVSGWIWPAVGKVTGPFAPAQGNKGINISGVAGSPIRAAAAGIVVYEGIGLPAYGKLIILKNSDDYLSAYAHNQSILVTEGEKVQQGQVIAKMGNTGTTKTMLHFEIRRNGQPVNPLLYLK